MANEITVICTNILKKKKKEEFTEAFTLKWMELINQYEKNKGQSAPVR